MTDTVLQPIDEPDLLVDRVAENLREAILTGVLPPGSRLSVPDLARRLGVSRTPVRDALHALERAGLAQTRPRRSTVVFGGGSAELQQLFELREALDGLAARLAAERMTTPERRQLHEVFERHRSALERGDVEGHIASDLEFHTLLREGARNLPLAEALARLRDQIVLVMRSCSSAPGGMGRGVQRDHTAILDAVAAGDPDAAEAAARSHVRNIARFTLTVGLGPPAGAGAGAEEP